MQFEELRSEVRKHNCEMYHRRGKPNSHTNEEWTGTDAGDLWLG